SGPGFEIKIGDLAAQRCRGKLRSRGVAKTICRADDTVDRRAYDHGASSHQQHRVLPAECYRQRMSDLRRGNHAAPAAIEFANVNDWRRIIHMKSDRTDAEGDDLRCVGDNDCHDVWASLI